MKIIFALIILSCSIPSICSAHSGAVLNAAANYLPLIAPFLAGGVAGVIKFIRNPFAAGSLDGIKKFFSDICDLFKRDKNQTP